MMPIEPKSDSKSSVDENLEDRKFSKATKIQSQTVEKILDEKEESPSENIPLPLNNNIQSSKVTESSQTEAPNLGRPIHQAVYNVLSPEEMTTNRLDKSGKSGKVSAERAYGDIVIHPNKPWPWVGAVQYNNGGFPPPVCSCCGRQKVPSPNKAVENVNWGQFADVEPFGKTTEVLDLPEAKKLPKEEFELIKEKDSRQSLAVTEATVASDHNYQSTPVQAGDTTLEATVDSCNCEETIEDLAENDVLNEQSSSSNTKEPYKSHEKPEKSHDDKNCGNSQALVMVDDKWQICWYPSLEITPSDGTEVTLHPMKQQHIFQDGHSVQRTKDAKFRGLIKRVSQSVDLFVLPDSKWVLKDLPSERVETLQELDHQRGQYVIYEGWIGTVFGIWKKVRFRMEDRTEFSITDDAQDFSIYFSEVLSSEKSLSVDSFQMYPGMKVRAPYFVLATASWENGFEPSELLKKKIASSEYLWEQRDAYSSGDKWWTAEFDVQCPKAHPSGNFVDKKGLGPYIIDAKIKWVPPKISASSESHEDTAAFAPEAAGEKTGKEENILAVVDSLTKGEMDYSYEELRAHVMEASQTPQVVALHALGKRKRTESSGGEQEEENMEERDKEGNMGPREDEKEKGEEDVVELELETGGRKQEPLVLTVVKVEPAKMDVEWRSKVSDEDENAEPPAKNILKEQDLKNTARFRVPASFASPRNIGTKYSYVVQSGDVFVAAECWRDECLRKLQGSNQEVSRKMETTAQFSGNFEKCDQLKNSTNEGSSKLETMNRPPMEGEECYVYLVKAESKLDVLWEDGSLEEGLDADSVVLAPLTVMNSTTRDFFPGMYVLLRKPEESEKQFGLISKANNAEKYATVRWMVEKPVGEERDEGVEEPVSDPESPVLALDKPVSESDQFALHNPVSAEKCLAFVNRKLYKKQKSVTVEELGNEDVSFYDIKSHPEFNYIGGSLVSRVTSLSGSGPEINVGYVVKKHPDGKVHVTWFNGTKSDLWPWELNNLYAEGQDYEDGEGSEGEDENYNYYSPTEHEYDEIEDLRYFDYAGLSEIDRFDRISLISALLNPMLILLERSVILISNQLPKLDRKQTVKLALRCDDVVSGLGGLAKFREPVRQFYKEKLDVDITVPVTNNKKSAMVNVSEDQLVWNIGSWLYDWLEVTSELQAAISKQRNRELKEANVSNADSQQPTTSTSNSLTENIALATAIPVDQEPKPGISEYTLPSAEDEHNFMEKPDGWTENRGNLAENGLKQSAEGTEELKPLSTEIADAQAIIQTGFTLIGQILNQDYLNDSTILLTLGVIDTLETANLALQKSDSSAREDTGQGDASDERRVLITEPEQEDCLVSLAFMKAFMSNTKKVTCLPCFSYTMPTERELSQIVRSWKSYAISDSDQPIRSKSEIKTLKMLVEKTTKLVKEFEKDNRKPSLPPDQFQTMVNDIADSLCLSVVVLLRAVTHLISKELNTNLTKLKERAKAPAARTVSDDFKMSLLTLKVSNALSIPGQTEEQKKEIVKNLLGEETDAETLEKLQAGTDLDLKDRGLEVPDPIAAPDLGLGGDRTCGVETEHFFGDALSPTSFEVLESAPIGHRFGAKIFDPSIAPKNYIKAIRKELKLLESALPPGIFVKSYEDRMDLFSCMIVGPQGTPYADGLFFFDVRLKEDYPSKPPHVFFKSMSKRLNPNLYEDGMVCLSLLGTWDGKENELWTPTSTLLQVFLSIQSLVLVAEPYYNEPGYEKERGTDSGRTKSKEYNENAILLTLESMEKVLAKPHEPFQKEIEQHFVEAKPRIQSFLERYQGKGDDLAYPLRPVTQGFSLCVKRHAQKIASLMQ